MVRENPQENESGNLGLAGPLRGGPVPCCLGTDIFIFSCLLSNGGCLGFGASRKGNYREDETSSKKSTWCSGELT